MTRPNPVNTSYQYDSVSRLLSVLHKIGSSTIDGATYTHDSAGNRTSKLNHVNSATDTYTYDLIYQLTQVTQSGNTTETYAYDQVGNRLSSLGVSPYSYNSSNQLTSTPQATFTYDQNGNTLTRVDSSGTTTYAWDYLNRLTSATLPGGAGVVTFKYDPYGRRIQKSSPSGVTIYAYDGADIAAEYDAAGNAVARYVQGPGVDQPLAMWRGGGISYHHADGLGSITSLTDGSGSAVAAYTRDSFGRPLATSDPIGNSFRFTAREWDGETGLYYYRARYYDPQAGRFIREDPIGWFAGLNFYKYAENDPLTLADPLGLWSVGKCLGAYDRFFRYYPSKSTLTNLKDKVAHCMAHCELQKECGIFGRMDSIPLSYGKEAYDQLRGFAARVDRRLGIPSQRYLPFLNPDAVWEWDDIEANKHGRTCPSNQSCWDRCKGAQTQFSSGK